ncbi:MAG: amidohydrolase [Oscillospiraceae bacterium]|nr:amidohydrolase [Oscillospiraceae bacterium]
MVITHAYIEPVVGKTIADGYLRFGAAIEEMGPMEQYVPKAGEEVLDAGGKWLLPGFVDIHTHLGLFGDGVGFEAEDCNESTDPITPQLRVIDGINPMDRTFEDARNGGVTAVIVAPGSANPIAGQAAAIRTYGRRIDDMILKAPVAMKFALGENPKSTYNDRDETPVTRMATAALIRENLRKAQEYRMKQQLAQEDPDFDAPDFDMKMEALVPVLNREIQAHFHAHRLDDIFTAIRIAKEFDLDYVIIHGTEAYLAPDIMAQEQARVVTGPNLLDRCKPELRNMSFSGPVVLTHHGVLCSICTDHPETPLQYLPLCAAMAMRSGLTRQEALAAITIQPARIAGLDKQIGSLEVGKDADLVLATGDPLELETRIEGVYSLGRKCV